MAQQARKRRGRTIGSQKKAEPGTKLTWEIPWSTQNLIGIGIGVGVIVVGYLLMGSAISDEPMTDKSIWNNSTATVVAPIVLTIAYCVIIPMAIFRRKKEEPARPTASES